jgi:hypothetical protein
MILERWTLQIKPGHVDEAVALLDSLRDDLQHPYGIRISKIMFGGADNRVDFRCAFENFAQREQFWGEWEASPGSALFRGKLHPLLSGGSEHDLWDLKSA